MNIDSGDRVFVSRHRLEVLVQFLDPVTCDHRDRGDILVYVPPFFSAR